jgi:hypothetical protein
MSITTEFREAIIERLSVSVKMSQDVELTEEAGQPVFYVAASLSTDTFRDGFISDCEHIGTKTGLSALWDEFFDGDNSGTVSELSGLLVPDPEASGDLLDALDGHSDDYYSAGAFIGHVENMMGRTLLIDKLFSRSSFSGEGLAFRLLDEIAAPMGLDSMTLGVAPMSAKHVSKHGIHGRDFDGETEEAEARLISHYELMGFVSAPGDSKKMGRRVEVSWLDDSPFEFKAIDRLAA